MTFEGTVKGTSRVAGSVITSYLVDNIPDIRPGSIDYIRSTYRNAIAYLDPADPDPMVAADRFGKLLHTAQDFYSHTNWINLLGLTTRPTPVSPEHLFERTLGEWPLIDLLGPVRDDIILGQIPLEGLPAGWSVTQALDSETPVFMTGDGTRAPRSHHRRNQTGSARRRRSGRARPSTSTVISR